MLAPMPRVPGFLLVGAPGAGALVVGALVAGAMPLAAEAAPRGRVVRVERDTLGPVPRRCSMAPGLGELRCYGEPRKGERIAVIDLSAGTVRGELVIESVSAELPAFSMCVNPGVHTVKAAYASGGDAGGDLLGLRGAKLDRRTARVMKDVPAPSGRAGDAVEVAVDTDGNGRADLVLTRYACDQDGRPSQDDAGDCFDTYMGRDGGLRRVHQDIFRVCR
jgi:hypothetical protein